MASALPSAAAKPRASGPRDSEVASRPRWWETGAAYFRGHRLATSAKQGTISDDDRRLRHAPLRQIGRDGGHWPRCLPLRAHHVRPADPDRDDTRRRRESRAEASVQLQGGAERLASRRRDRQRAVDARSRRDRRRQRQRPRRDRLLRRRGRLVRIVSAHRDALRSLLGPAARGAGGHAAYGQPPVPQQANGAQLGYGQQPQQQAYGQPSTGTGSSPNPQAYRQPPQQQPGYGQATPGYTPPGYGPPRS